MTLEEIRRQKKLAEESILHILATLSDRTELTPASVDYQLIDASTMMDERRRYAIGPVTITLEGI
jgi:hypothetical protein